MRVGTRNHAAVHQIKPHGDTPEKRQDRKETPSRPRAQTPGTASRSQRPTSSCAPRQAGSRTPQGGERGPEGCGRLNLEKMQTCASHRRSKRLWDPHAARTALQGPRAWRRAHLGAALRGPDAGRCEKAPGAGTGLSLQLTPLVPLRKKAEKQRATDSDMCALLRPCPNLVLRSLQRRSGYGFPSHPGRRDPTVYGRPNTRLRPRKRVPGPSCAATPQWASSAWGPGGAPPGCLRCPGRDFGPRREMKRLG